MTVFGKLQPRQVSKEEFEQLDHASRQQTGKATTPKSRDEENYPVYSNPINKKVLFYIPNHTMVDEEGNTVLRTNKCAIHTVKDGASFLSIRCTQGITLEGYDGTCPLCEAVSRGWDLYNFQKDEQARIHGIDASNKEAMKPYTTQLLDKRIVRDGDVTYTFPIVEVQLKESKLEPATDKEGHLIARVYWYSTKEKTFIDKFLKAMESFDYEAVGLEPVTNLAGQWLIMDYTYTVEEGKQHNKRDSAQNLKVQMKAMPKAKYGEIEKYFDELTNDWSPEKATEVVISNNLYPLETLTEITDQLMKPTLDKIAFYESMLSTASATAIGGATTPTLTDGSTDAEAIAKGFGQKEGQAPTQAGGQVPNNTVENANVPPQA